MGFKHPHAAADRGRCPTTALVQWREAQLRRVGFDAPCAAAVAADLGFDLHAVIELVERGCPPELALRIAAPLRGERPC